MKKAVVAANSPRFHPDYDAARKLPNFGANLNLDRRHWKLKAIKPDCYWKEPELFGFSIAFSNNPWKEEKAAFRSKTVEPEAVGLKIWNAELKVEQT